LHCLANTGSPIFNGILSLLLVQDSYRTVLRNRKAEVFQSKEDQILIEQQFNAKVRRTMYSQLLCYILFLASLTWLGMLMTTRDAQSAFMLNQGIIHKVRRPAFLAVFPSRIHV